MNKYIFKFTKKDQMKYISHLDLMRLLQGAFRRSDIKIIYSQGFSPHPKLSIAHPLSLGISSVGEYMEVEIENELCEDKLKAQLNTALPRGIQILSCKKIIKTKKSLAALVEYATYHIFLTIFEDISKEQLINKTDHFLSFEEIIAIKKQIKKKTEKKLNIKPFIKTFSVEGFNDKQYQLNAMIKTGSNGNLNPGLLINSFLEYTNLNINHEDTCIIRENLYSKKDNLYIPLMDSVQ